MEDYIQKHKLNTRLLTKSIKSNKNINEQMSAFTRKAKTNITIFKGRFHIDDDVPILDRWNKNKTTLISFELNL